MARLVRELFGVPKPKGKDDLAPEADDPPWPDVKVVVIVNKRSGSRLVRPLDMPAPNASSSARARSLSGDPPSPPPAHPPSSAPACQGKRLARKLVEVRSRTPVRFPPRASPFARPSPRPSPDGARVYPDGAKSPVVENISTSRLAARLVPTRRVRLVPTRRVRPHTPPLPSADTPRRTAASFTSTNTFAAATRSRRSWCPWSPRTDPATTFAVAAGGDGTVSWVAELIHDACALVGTRNVPPIAILSLGTGNELARVTGWGAAYDGRSLVPFVRDVASGKVIGVDSWLARDAAGSGSGRTNPRSTEAKREGAGARGGGQGAARFRNGERERVEPRRGGRNRRGIIPGEGVARRRRFVRRRDERGAAGVATIERERRAPFRGGQFGPAAPPRDGVRASADDPAGRVAGEVRRVEDGEDDENAAFAPRVRGDGGDPRTRSHRHGSDANVDGSERGRGDATLERVERKRKQDVVVGEARASPRGERRRFGTGE